MSQVMLEDADSRLAQLVEQVSKGEEVVIIQGSVPIAKIVPMPTEPPAPRKSGFGSGKYALVHMADDFDAPLDDFKEHM